MTAAVPRVEASLVAALRSDLGRSGFTVAQVEDLLGPVAAAALHREQVVPAVQSLARHEHRPAAGTLLQAFVLGRGVRRRHLDAALPALGTTGAERLGLVRAAGTGPDDDVVALVDLRPYLAEDDTGEVGWWIVSDPGELATGRGLRPDHVLGVGGASTTLAGLTIREHRARTLDLGTGCGIQALHASRHSDVVVGTDVSRRALAFAAFNTALADVRVDLREGSLLEPVGGPGEAPFDLVVSNPPFVITPRSGAVAEYEYRDGGRSGDDLVRELVTSVGRVLAPGGVAQMLGNWEHRRGEDWTERVGGWLDDSGLDGWVVQREVLDPAEYAETWLRDGGVTADRDPRAWEDGYAAWLDDFAARDVQAVGLGMVVLRRPGGGAPTLRRLEERSGQVQQPLGSHLAAVLAAHDNLAVTDDDALWRETAVAAPDVTEERHLRPGDTHPSVVLLRQGGGFGRSVQAGTALAGLVGTCDGDLTLGQITAGIAALLDVDAAALRRELTPQVRDLVRDGLLVLSGRGGSASSPSVGT